MIPIYADENVRGAVIRGLRLRGVDLLTVWEDGFAEADDPDVLHRAGALQRLLYTEDEDLLAIAAHWQRSGVPFVGVVYGHQLRLPISQCIASLELIATASDLGEYAGRVVYLPI